jgi:hypothetical protein
MQMLADDFVDNFRNISLLSNVISTCLCNDSLFFRLKLSTAFPPSPIPCLRRRRRHALSAPAYVASCIGSLYCLQSSFVTQINASDMIICCHSTMHHAATIEIPLFLIATVIDTPSFRLRDSCKFVGINYYSEQLQNRHSKALALNSGWLRSQ